MTKKTRWQTILSMTLALVSSSAMAQSVLDHYLSYDIEAFHFSRDKVFLSDQFMNSGFVVGRPTRLLNPTVKRHNDQVFPINNKKLHYTGYKIRPVDEIKIDKSVIVFNQFGIFTLNKFEPTLLLAPSIKREILIGNEIIDEEEALIKADHYLCYDIEDQEVPYQFGFLKDQFGGRDFGKLIAKRLCNPVTKEHDGKVYDIIDNSIYNHLMCFEIEQESIFRLVTLRDQFSKKLAWVYQSNEVCVPSTKIEVPNNPCSFDDAGVCGGECDNGLVCGIDTANMCSCIPEVIECGFLADGTCGGACPENLNCEFDAASESCQCLQPTQQCGFDADGVCGGVCDDGATCVQNENNECSCVVISCERNDEGICGGVCPDQELCLDTENGCQCVAE